jgi:hypothetical protein
MAAPDEISGMDAKLEKAEMRFELASISIAATEHAEPYPR